MIIRMLVAAIGALTITAALFLGMDAVTTVFREQSTERGYRISDVVRRDRSERQARPETRNLPEVPDLEPEPAPAVELTGDEPAVAPIPALERPRLTLDSDLSQPAVEPDSD